jgi:hypothetical protein
MDKSQRSAQCTQWEDESWAVITEVTQQALTEMAKSWRAKGKTHGIPQRSGHHGTVPEGTSLSKVDELCSAEAMRAPLSSPKRAIWSGSGARRSVQANGAALGSIIIFI